MKCKGTHKDTYGMGCKTEQPKRKLGLGIDCGCYSHFLLNTPQGKERIKRISVKVSEPRIKAQKELQKGFEEKKNRDKLTNLLKSVKDTCHKYIRLRDKGKPCISCGQPWHKDFQAGHLYKSELFSTIRFNELNINGQCRKCNLMREGNESEYMLRLPKRIGEELFSDLQCLAEIDHRRNHKWDREKLIKIRKYYQNKIKNLL